MKEWLKRLVGKETLEWEEYKKLISDREYLDFISHSTFVSATNLLDKGK